MTKPVKFPTKNGLLALLAALSLLFAANCGNVGEGSTKASDSLAPVEETLANQPLGNLAPVITKDDYEEALTEELDGTFTYQEFITFDSADGTEIAANLFHPNTSNAATRLPAIIFVNSWSLEEHEYIVQAAKFAKDGYIVLSYSTRGFGLSEGYINVAGPHDMLDLDAALNYLEANTQVDVANIGIAGISYGGGISLLGLAQHERIKTAVSMSGWTSLVEALWGAETPRLVWGAVLLASGYVTGNMDPIIAELYGNLLKYEDVNDTMVWALARSPISYIDMINSANKPVYLSNNFADNLFQPNAILDFYDKLTVPKKLDLNQGIHATAEIGGLLGLNNYVWNNAHRWFDYWLKGINTGIMNEDPVSMQLKFSHERETYADYPIAGVSEQTLTLKPRTLFSHGKLLSGNNSSYGSEKFYSGIDTIATTGIPLLSPIIESHIGGKVQTAVNLISKVNGAMYQSDKLSGQTKLRGIAKMKLTVTPTKSKAQLHAYLYDVDKWGVGTLITHGSATLNDATAGAKTQLDINLVATAYNVPAGHRIAIAIDTFDALYAVPTLSVYNVKVHHSASEQNTLVLPVLQ